MSITVKSILKTKGSSVWSIGPDETVLDALKLLAEKNIGAVLVTEGGRIAGILSERDYARKVILKGKASKDTRVREIMTAKVVAVDPSRTVEECMALMTGSRIRHLPVIEADRVIGVISIGDVVNAVIADQKFEIDQLSKYITGSL